MASASAPLKKVMNVANGVHVALYRMSGGKFAGRVANMPILLLRRLGENRGSHIQTRSFTSKTVKIIWWRPRQAAWTGTQAGIST